MLCGLLGRKLGHSYSPQIHSHLGDYAYVLFEKEPEELEDFLKNGDFTGINVTIPYKKAVIEYCDQLTDRARALGAVNTIVRKPDGTLTGHNTDFFGFSAMVEKSGLSVSGKKALVLGSGGASATAVAVLEEKGATVVVISRSGENNYENLHLHADAALIVNATPVGMYPNVDGSPIDLRIFPKLEGVLDLIYNPANTRLLLAAQERGITAMNGLWMLVAQAKEAAEWFAGEKISDDVIASIHQQLRTQMKNIVLVGMPGSGKTTIGKELAERLGRQFVDTDALIVQNAGCSIPEIFQAHGQEYFRKLETEAIAQVGKSSSLVIATGGGCVTINGNYPLLRQNSTVFWIKRDLSALPTDGRPLSQAGALEEMYRIREPMYRHFSDHVVENNTDPIDAVEAILSLLTKEE